MRRTIPTLLGAISLLALSACGSSGSAPSTAASVCAQIADSGVGAACGQDEPGGLGIGAIENYTFTLPSVPGESGQVMVFDDPAIYEKTVEAYDDMRGLAGPHRYGNADALVFVQINEGLSAGNGEKVKAIVDGLGS